nr:DUF3459 domain-containing protein [candidate division Zixibacteria bacterium]NIT58776.1 DUF3459 domain-containing protein [Fodinibius sp.]NIW50151.1 DUF3459 domain-containing protein [Gammaproteobacteria bacterium]NIS49039.1 DUF3459 domain-containing protein [candidate division Zixibacteria bacterium]NIU17125.1 DUF3459 domain-containing protein [candidate division Zixibacteria bacterium]
PFMDWEKANEAQDWTGLTGRIYKGINHLIRARKQTHAFHAQALAFAVWTHNIHVFGLIRESPRGRLLILANFSENVQTVPRYRIHDMKFKGQLHDHLDGQNYDGSSDMALEPYQTLWLESMGKNQ